MVKSKSQQIVLSGLFIALGLILPYFTAHAFAVPGTILLPMHIPVLLCGLICGPQYGALLGVIVPVVSSMLTGMPPVYPMLPIMVAQLVAMGLISGMMYHKLRLPIYPSLLISMVCGWALYGLTFAILMLANSGLRALSVTAAVVQGLPGIGIQLVLIPILVTAINRYGNRSNQAEPLQEDILAQAQQLIKAGGVSCVVIRDGIIIHTADGRGVSPLMKLYNSEPEQLKNAFVVDKIIGKAAAMILVLGGVTKVYGLIMSVAGRTYLEQHGIVAEYGRCVDIISNRDQNGICPIEKSVLDTDDPIEGLARITETIKELMNRAG